LEMDAGDILLQERVAIAPEDTGETLTRRLAELGAVLMLQALDQVAQGIAAFTPQDHAQATHCRLFEKSDGRIDWRQPAQRIHNLVRAAQPWPGAHCLLKGEVVRILGSQPIDAPAEQAPGTVVHIEKDRVLVATGRGLLAVTGIQPPGKKAMTMGEYLRGRPMEPGTAFESLP
ncbi:MAG: methionyl-tRNA formyltransferase, partial [Candidatus Hydrogenedentes bacterium]|nr:methionyl-tRNA formyltransferase [Candidatus Hydrogenedentota bacterium]